LNRFLLSKNIKNSLWNFLDIFLYPILFFSTTSFFIDRLGENEFGIWMLMNSIMISMQLFNLGLGSATFKNVALHLSKNDIKSLSETLNTNISLCMVIHVACIILSIILSVGIRYFSFFNIEKSFVELSSISVIFAGFIVGLKFYEQIVSFYFKASERFDLAAILNSGLKLSILGINIVFVYFGYGLIQIFICTISVSLIGLIIGVFIIKSRVDSYRFSIYFNKKSILKEINFAIWTWLQSLVVIITFQCDRFFVVSFFGLTTMTYYGLVATIFNHIHMGFNSIVPWLAPQVTKLKSKNINTDKLYFSSQNLCVSIGLIALLVFNFVNPFLFKIILSTNKFIHINQYVKYFTLFEIFFIYSIVPNYYLNAAGYEKKLFYIVLLYCSLSILGMLCGYFYFNSASGILVGLTIAMFISMFIQNWIIASKLFERNGFTFAIKSVIPAIFISFVVLIDTLFVKIFFSFFALSTLYLYFYKEGKINFSLLKFNGRG